MKQLKHHQTKFWIQAALIAAIYATLTILLGSISYGPVQFRIAEALTILPALTPAGIPGLFVGCLVANILGPYGLIDMVLGGGATLIAAILSYQLRKKPLLVPLPPVLVNAVVIGMMLYYVYAVPMSLLACMATVGLGQLVTCYGIGYPLLKILGRYENIFK
jgi:uncharacterized membrane protein